MVSRFIIISAAIALLGTVTFAQTNPLVDDIGDSRQFLTEKRSAAYDRLVEKRNLFGKLLTNGASGHEKQATAPQGNTPIANQLPAQGNAGGGGPPPPPKGQDSDEQAGDKFDAGDDQPDEPGHEAKRSVGLGMNNKRSAMTEPLVIRRDKQQPTSEDDDEDIADEDDEGTEEKDTPDSSTSHDAKRELKVYRRSAIKQRMTKRDMDMFIAKTQYGVDKLIDKTSKFADKVGGGGDDDTKSGNLPDGHSTDTKHATDAVANAKSVANAAKKGDIKAMHESQ